MTRDEYVELIKSAALTSAKKGVMAFLVENVPLFRLGFFNFVGGIVVGWVLQKAIYYTELGAFFLYTDMRVAGQADKFIEAAKINQKAQAGGTNEEKQKAEADLIASFRDLVKFTT